jgi:hypothetical protein
MFAKVIFSLLILLVHCNYACDCITFDNCDNHVKQRINPHCTLCLENNELIGKFVIKYEEPTEYFFGVGTKTYLTNIHINCSVLNEYTIDYLFSIYSKRTNKFLRRYNLSDRYYYKNNISILMDNYNNMVEYYHGVKSSKYAKNVRSR